MPDKKKLCLIVADRANEAELEAIHEIAKVHSTNGWWHWFESAWFVTGYDAPYWRTLIKPVLPTGPSSILVLPIDLNEMPPQYFGPKSTPIGDWFEKLKGGPPKAPPVDPWNDDPPF